MSNNQSQKNIPNGWQELKLVNVFDFKNGLNKEKKYFGKGSPIINYTDVYRGGGLFIKNILGKVDVNKSELERFNVQKGDVFFTRTSETLKEIGFSAVALDDFRGTVFSGFVLRARPKDQKTLLPDYAKYCFTVTKARQEITEKSSYTTRALTSGSLLNHVKLPFPPLPEQKRIIKVLEVWDSVIEKLARKIEVKKNIKKSLMQKLLTGKVRLPGFSEKWQNIKLGQVGEIVTGNTPPMKNAENYGNEFCWATAEDFNSKYIKDTNIKLSEAGKLKSRFLPVGSILVTCIASLGKNAIAWVPLATNQQINSIIVNPENNNEFIYYIIENSSKLLRKTAGAGAMPILNKSSFANIRIKIPNLKEQMAVAEVLTKSDEEIELLQKKLNKLKDQKRYLLNNLITGKIRTPEKMIIN